jgi:hypothetical protein
LLAVAVGEDPTEAVEAALAVTWKSFRLYRLVLTALLLVLVAQDQVWAQEPAAQIQAL